jgi:large subunit ribosomal protein L3
MIQGLIGKKVGMTHLFNADSQVVSVTVLEVGPCVVTQVRTSQRDGYEAVQVGFGHAKQLTKPARGHLKASGADSRVLHEFSADDISNHTVGDALPVTLFQPGDVVDVTGKSKGRGFQGAVKRYGFAGGRKTHGQGDRHRAVGSIGAGTYPGRVFKGKRMPGHMGDKQVTSQRLIVERVDPERNLLMVRGAVPGARNGMVTVKYSKGIQVATRLSDEEWNELLGVEVEPEVIEEVVEEEAPAEEAVEETVAEVAVADETAEEEAVAEEPVAEATEEPATEEAADEAGESEDEDEGKAE